MPFKGKWAKIIVLIRYLPNSKTVNEGIPNVTEIEKHLPNQSSDKFHDIYKNSCVFVQICNDRAALERQ